MVKQPKLTPEQIKEAEAVLDEFIFDVTKVVDQVNSQLPKSYSLTMLGIRNKEKYEIEFNLKQNGKSWAIVPITTPKPIDIDLVTDQLVNKIKSALEQYRVSGYVDCIKMLTNKE